MRYGSVCSGIEAATVAWHPLGWEPAWFCEIDPFPSAVLRHHYPEVPNHGDFTKLERPAAIDLLVGGTPCQDFSVAGLRAGIDGERGQLTLEFLRLVQRTEPRWLVWENVPGVLSANGGRAFGAFVGGLAECGYGFAWRVLDAQYVRVDGYPGAVPQRRRRVFVVACAGGRADRAGEVLFEREGMSRHPPTRIHAWEGAAAGAGCGFEVCGTLSDGAHHGGGLNGQDAYTGRILPVAFAKNQGVQQDYRVRRLTPVECERLQGFPDDYTRIPWRGKPAEDCPDGLRYRALGNSMACNVMRWIGRRIEMVEART